MKFSLFFISLSIIWKFISGETVAKWDEKLSKCQGIEIREINIKGIHKLYFKKKLTSEKLTECYLNRISKMNPFLNAVIEVNPDALKIATELDRKFKSEGKLTGVLHGVPILIKDIFDTNDSMNTTAGSLALLESKPEEDALVVKLLRKEGAIIIGKTNLSEFAGFQSIDAPPGWSNRGGQTKNPYVLSASPNGSSSGSAVAVAANLALVALGSETMGSIISPSAVCLAVGFKPSVGSISGKGVIPLTSSIDSIGAITRSVSDNIVVTYAIAKASLKASLSKIYKYNIKKSGILISEIYKDLKVGIIQDRYLEDNLLPEEQVSVLNEMSKHLQSSGIVAKNVTIDFSSLSPEKVDNVVATEFKYYLNKYLKKRVKNIINPKISSLADIIDFNKQLDESENPYDQTFLEKAQNTTGLNSLSYQKDYMEMSRITSDAIITTMATNKLDAIIVPSYLPLGGFIPSDLAGFPVITIPVGIGRDGVPFGMSIYSLKNYEPNIVYIASVLSKTYQRVSPQFL